MSPESYRRGFTVLRVTRTSSGVRVIPVILCEIGLTVADWNHIYNYGLTKTTLWLNGHDLAAHLSPTSHQVVKFLADRTGREPRDVDEDDPAMWWGAGYFAQYITPLGNIARALSRVRMRGVGLWPSMLGGNHPKPCNTTFRSSQPHPALGLGVCCRASALELTPCIP